MLEKILKKLEDAEEDEKKANKMYKALARLDRRVKEQDVRNKPWKVQTIESFIMVLLKTSLE